MLHFVKLTEEDGTFVYVQATKIAAIYRANGGNAYLDIGSDDYLSIQEEPEQVIGALDAYVQEAK